MAPVPEGQAATSFVLVPQLHSELPYPQGEPDQKCVLYLHRKAFPLFDLETVVPDQIEALAMVMLCKKSPRAVGLETTSPEQEWNDKHGQLQQVCENIESREGGRWKH